MTTGLNTGDVGLRVVLAEESPPVGVEWEDVVEVPFLPRSRGVGVAPYDSDFVCTLRLPSTPHRVRYSARGMDAGDAAGVVMGDEPIIDTYELAFWPADPAPEAILRQGSRMAAFWHSARNPAAAPSRRAFRTGSGPQAPATGVRDRRWRDG